MTTDQHDAPFPEETRSTAPVLGGAIVLSVLSASCCVLPISLSILGLSGSWLALLDPLVEYRSFILVMVAIVIAWTWFRILKAPDLRARNRQLAFVGLSSVVFVFAVSAPLWEFEVARELWSYMKQSP